MNPAVIRGVAALKEMLDCIGGNDGEADDHKVAKILVLREPELRALLYQVCSDLADADLGD